jgi:predicted nuclease of predicted toxin-antitoxin system
VLRFAVDEDFNNRIVRGLLRLLPTLDIVRVQDADLSGSPDPSVLEWAAAENRVLLSHDVTTMATEAYDRVRSGKPMVGVFEVSQEMLIREAIADLVLIATCSIDGEYDGQVRYLPLR